MSKRYLVIETHIIGHKDKCFIHFIDLKEKTFFDVEHLINHLYWFPHQTVDKICFRDTRLTNW